MKKTIFALIAIGSLVACNKKDAKFCYTCSQKVTYKVKDTIPAHSQTISTEYCDKTYKDIVTLEQDNPGQETPDSTTYQLECVREQ